MKEFIVVYFTSPNTYGNKYYQAYSKKGAFKCFKVEDSKSIIINIIEL